MSDETKFDLPEGFTLPEGATKDQPFDVTVTLKLLSDKEAQLVAVNGVSIKPETTEEEESPEEASPSPAEESAPEGEGFLSAMNAPQPQIQG